MIEHQFESSEGTSGTAEAAVFGDWTIGQGRPPVEYQFPKGWSGKPADSSR
jgi:hypothetical protein